MTEYLPIPESDRPQGIYIAGNPGFGKSSLIQRLALQDIKRQRGGVCVIDPTGDLVNILLDWIPEKDVSRTIYFDTSTPTSIDFFSYHDADERQILTDELVKIFNLENAPVARPRLRKIIGTLFDANENPRMTVEDRATFLDISAFIENEDRRKVILGYCSKERQDVWRHVPKESDLTAITERMLPFHESPALRKIVGSKTPTLNIWDVIRNKQILLVNLKDSETDLFIGSLIVAKIQQAIFRTRMIPEDKRTPFYLYIDEFQTILQYNPKDFAKILTRARKYKLCITLGNQIPQDLPDEIKQKLGTIATLILFNLDSNNSRIFKDRIAPFDLQTLLDLVKFEAIFVSQGHAQKADTLKYLPPSPASYAEIITNRKTSGSSCKPAPVSHTESNVPPGNTDDGKSEDKRTLQSDRPQSSNLGKPRKV